MEHLWSPWRIYGNINITKLYFSDTFYNRSRESHIPFERDCSLSTKNKLNNLPDFPEYASLNYGETIFILRKKTRVHWNEPLFGFYNKWRIRYHRMLFCSDHSPYFAEVCFGKSFRHSRQAAQDFSTGIW